MEHAGPVHHGVPAEADGGGVSRTVQLLDSSSGTAEKINDAFMDAHREGSWCAHYAPLVKVFAVVGLEIADALYDVAASIRTRG